MPQTARRSTFLCINGSCRYSLIQGSEPQSPCCFAHKELQELRHLQRAARALDMSGTLSCALHLRQRLLAPMRHALYANFEPAMSRDAAQTDLTANRRIKQAQLTEADWGCSLAQDLRRSLSAYVVKVVVTFNEVFPVPWQACQPPLCLELVGMACQLSRCGVLRARSCALE
ncbi:unnamed protein product [Effrenium voratum]|uniref:Uncharacterized protein n=1 Tax=Effrenium voratum TaxID=2562239 RepID=A0AA36JH03_9DINO|nr:unnamed protein product [Effrenium voratum]